MAAVYKYPTDIDGMLSHVVYLADRNVEEGYVYTVGDSNTDLGLLDAVEKNFMKLMGIIVDYLD